VAHDDHRLGCSVPFEIRLQPVHLFVVYKTSIASAVDELGVRDEMPPPNAIAAPAFASVRPDATHDPSIELSEELSNVSPLVVVTPTTQFRV
jgi:hypothetical protein